MKHPAKDFRKVISSINKLAITSWNVDDDIYINMRIYDGLDSSWFDSLNIPDLSKKYLTKAKIRGWKNAKRSKIICYIEASNSNLTLSNYDICTFCYNLPEINRNKNSFVIIDKKSASKFPNLII